MCAFKVFVCHLFVRIVSLAMANGNGFFSYCGLSDSQKSEERYKLLNILWCNTY